MPILCSTGALIGRPNRRDYTLLRDIAPKLGCDGFELMIYPDWYLIYGKLIDFTHEIGINIPVIHCEKSIGELLSSGNGEDLNTAMRNFRLNCEIAKGVGAEKLVLHLWNGLVSDSHIENNFAGYRYLREISDEYGLALLVENVVCNVSNPMQRCYELHETYPDAEFVFDTKMAAFHCQEEKLYDDENAWLQDSIRHYHVNDYGGGYMDWSNLRVLPIGDGRVDFDKFFSYIKRKNHKDFTFTVESTAFDKTGVVHTEILNRCFDTIRKYLSEGSGSVAQ
ncbi:MAG: sugar phosphate isomerase/epimerase [Oscillospiraceae bacterium]|nr:sugar phosphate isomerase/epimerase [Oscillospiraceae bacterium]